MAKKAIYLFFVWLLIYSKSTPAQSSDFCALGEQFFKNQEYRQAQSALWQCVTSSAATQDQGLYLAWTYRDQRDYGAGLSRAEKALQQQPAEENLLYLAAFLNFRLNQLEQSVGLLNRAYKLKPDDWRLHQLYALNFVEVGWASAAEQELNRAIKLKPDMPELHYQLARYYCTMNQFDKAVDASQKALALAPEYAEVYENLGVAYAGLGDLSKAVENFENAIKIDKKRNLKDEWPLIDYGAFLEGQDLAKAEAILKEALKINPDNATANYELGRTMQQLGRDTEAETYLTQAIKQDPTYPGAYYLLSGLARKRGDHALAATYLGEYQKLKDQEKKDGTSSSVLSARHR